MTALSDVVLGPDDYLVLTSKPSTPQKDVDAAIAQMSTNPALNGRVIVVNGDSWVSQVVRCGPQAFPCCEHCVHGAEVKAHTQPCGRES